jgi:hypothetical protein
MKLTSNRDELNQQIYSKVFAFEQTEKQNPRQTGVFDD